MLYTEFIDYLNTLDQTFFIEAEAKPDKMDIFVNNYNSEYSPSVNIDSEGICVLGANVDKWAVELRIYLNDIEGMPEYWAGRKYLNNLYHKDEFRYRIDDNKLVRALFEDGFRIGYN